VDVNRRRPVAVSPLLQPTERHRESRHGRKRGHQPVRALDLSNFHSWDYQ
jgi:hypothetical protein